MSTSRKPVRNQGTTWLSAFLIGIGALLFLFWLADPNRLIEQMRNTRWFLLAAALLPLSVEVLFTSLRVQHCVNYPVSLRLAMYSNSIYIAWLSLLPARLGEVAGVAVFNKKLGMPIGSAVASVIVQRVYDVLILAGLLVVSLTQSLYGGQLGLVLACLVLIGLIIVLYSLPFWLGCSARILYTKRQIGFLKRLLHVILQARTWYRHQSAPSSISWLVGTTFGKWCVNLIAVVMIFKATGIQLDLNLLFTVAVLMHFLGAIPLQSFGGFGAAEVGVAGILASLGAPPEQAVAAGLLVRMVSLCFAGLFFTFGFLTLRTQ